MVFPKKSGIEKAYRSQFPMVKKYKYIQPNKWYHSIYNYCCYWLVLFFGGAKNPPQKEIIQSPVFLTGFFRSGTSFLTSTMEVLGADLGPKNHLLQSKGARSDLNPNGFFENYLFMDWSLFIFHKTDSWGHIPVTAQKMQSINFETISLKELCFDSFCHIHDERISNLNKIKTWRSFGQADMADYVNRNFSNPCVIKNPHFCLFPEVLLQIWPKCRFLVVFRKPSDSLISAEKIIPGVSVELWLTYYERMLEYKGDVSFFNYDQLLIDPYSGLKALCENYSLKSDKIEEALAGVKIKSDVVDQNENFGSRVNSVYNRLKSLSINQ
ncbi:MAG: hypothetical protein ACK40M_01605 [Flavobacteriales bacterium]